jgi:hypothetical protein
MKKNRIGTIITIIELILIVWFSVLLYEDRKKPPNVQDCVLLLVIGEFGVELYSRYKTKVFDFFNDYLNKIF